MKYPSILYWKWDDQHLHTKSYLDKIDDIVNRSCFDHICITTHWCENGIAHGGMHEHIRLACERIHQHNRKIIFEIDVRAEKKLFAEKFPNSRMGFIYWKSQQPDSSGHNTFSFPIKKGCGGELFFGDRQDGEELVAAFAYQKDDEGKIIENSIESLNAQASLIRQDEETVTVSLPYTENKELFVAVCSFYRFPDFWSADYADFLNELMQKYSDIPLDGLSVDELGLLWYPDFDFTPGSYFMLDNAPVYGYSLAECFKRKYAISYEKSLLFRFCSTDDDRNKVRAINYYFDFIRNGLSATEHDFYLKTKKYFGQDAFVGVHSTWYAIEEVANTPEVWKTGITWWSAKRDYGFTDEIMLYPVRTALAHKENAPIFYNMWYGEATGDIDTYYTELYKNARFGGRTISLGYECTHEASVLDLYPTGLLESLSEIEKHFITLDNLQKSATNCDIAVIMGLEACCSRIANQNENGQWDIYRGVLKETFTLTRDIFHMGYNADMIGSCAIEDGSLRINEQGYLTYGSQKYYFAIIAYPEFCKPEFLTFLSQLQNSKTKFCVVGTLHRDFEGKTTSLPANIIQYITRPDAYDLQYLFEQSHVSHNRVPNGCVLQDGSMIFTAPSPSKPTGNLFESTFTVHGKEYYLQAEDIAYLSFKATGEPDTIWSPRLITFQSK